MGFFFGDTVDTARLFDRYCQLQRYIGWEPADEERVRAAAPALKGYFAAIVDDFYQEIERHPEAAKVITGGAAQIERLKQSLRSWLEELFFGRRDADYVARRWQVGLRHVQVGLNQIYVNAAISRMRSQLLRYHGQNCSGSVEEILKSRQSISRLIDLDLAIIEDAYQTEYLAWQNREERQKLLQSERLAAIGETMTGLVHESRNALQRCRACLEMLSMEVTESPKALDLVQRIQRAQDDLQQLFEEVREYAAPLTIRRSQCDLSEVWKRAWNELAHLHNDKHLTLVEHTNGHSPQGQFDPFALGQVFRNVLENAIHASPRGGQVLVSCLRAQSSQSGDLQVSIRDQGPGIPPELRTRVLEPFFTTKAKGTGLGLAIVRRIVESHGGKIEVGQPSSGSEISIYLPGTPS